METRKPATPQTTAAHDPVTPQALIDFMSQGWADVPAARGPGLPQRERYRARREALSAAYPASYLVVPSGTEKMRANDTNFRFRPSTDFAYLVGPGESAGMLVLEPRPGGHDAVLFVPAHNRGHADFFTDRVYGELWVGRHRGVEESREHFGVDRALPISAMEEYLNDLRLRGADVRVARGHSGIVDAAFDDDEQDKEFSQHLSEMRLIKDDFEIAELRRCVEITKRAFEDAIRILPRATSEREIEAAFWGRARIEANDVGYLTIAAAGEHACTLHWTHNHGHIRAGELLLLDAGVEVESLYTADVTRTLPISGRFSAEQRTVYELVHKAQAAAFAHVKPGNDFLAPHDAAMRVLAEGLTELGLLTCSLDEALDPQNQFFKRYTLHGTSHMLGLDVHDCAKARSETYKFGKLQAGMALTVEPGLYFQPDDATVPERFRGIGVRIEDDVVVTAHGHENLSSILPSAAGDVEAWIAAVTAS